MKKVFGIILTLAVAFSFMTLNSSNDLKETAEIKLPDPDTVSGRTF